MGVKRMEVASVVAEAFCNVWVTALLSNMHSSIHIILTSAYSPLGNVSMCVCVCVCVHWVCVHWVCVSVCLFKGNMEIHWGVSIRVYVCIYVCVCLCVHASMCVYVYVLYTCYVNACSCIHVCVCISYVYVLCVCVCVYQPIHTVASECVDPLRATDPHSLWMGCRHPLPNWILSPFSSAKSYFPAWPHSRLVSSYYHAYLFF